MNAKAQYTGHGVNTGGLQQHSLGEDYPFIVVGTGTKGHWYVLNGVTGDKSPICTNYRDAQTFVEYGKLLRRIKSCIEQADNTQEAIAYCKGYAYAYAPVSAKTGNPYQYPSTEYNLFGKGFADGIALRSMEESLTVIKLATQH